MVALRIFLSYRRSDSAATTDRLRDRLVREFGEENVYTDVTSLPPAVDYRRALRDLIGECDVMLVVIGPMWTSVQDDGRRRLEESEDTVRAEVEAGLKSGMPVVPILVSGAQMPTRAELPDSIAELSFRNAFPIRRDPDFHNDVDRLLTTKPFVRSRWAATPHRVALNVSAMFVVAVALAVTVAIALTARKDGGPDDDATRSAENVSGASKILPVPGAALWLDAADEATVTADREQQVVQWSDKAANGVDFDVVDGAVETGTRLLNDMNVVNFAGGYLATSEDAGFHVGEFTLFMVMRTDTVGGTRNSRLFSGSDGTTDWGSNSGVAVTRGDGLGLRIERHEQGAVVPQLDLTSPAVIGLRATAASSEFVVDGRSIATSESDTDFGWGMATELFLMGRNDQPNTVGYLAEVIVLPTALSDPNMDIIGQYLATKWNLTWQD